MTFFPLVKYNIASNQTFIFYGGFNKFQKLLLVSISFSEMLSIYLLILFLLILRHLFLRFLYTASFSVMVEPSIHSLIYFCINFLLKLPVNANERCIITSLQISFAKGHAQRLSMKRF